MLVGMAKGGLPMVGMLSVPLLSLVIPPVQAAGLLLPIYVASDVFGVIAYRRAWDGRVLAILIPGMTAGVVLGWLAASVTPERVVTLLVGAIGAAFALVTLLRRAPDGPPRQPRLVPGLFWGAVTGFTSFVSHAGAPPYQVYVLPMRLDKAVYAGTTTLTFAFVNAIKLPPYWALGQLNPANLTLAAALMPLAAAAVWLGVWLVRVLPARQLFALVTWSLLAVSVKLIWDGLAG
ncbi:MAG: sulfite exporter TauE/SafE family protein [Rhodobacterales bacterium]|nr:sulfite exporter TauE/SafE family protein [Rhodobacterales bacterium]